MTEAGGQAPAGLEPPSAGRVFLVTAYCPCRLCCGRWADVPDERRTFADGSRFDRAARVAAVDTRVIPFGARLAIPGYGPAVARDRGGGIKGHRIDVMFPTHAQARAWGVRRLSVEVRP